MLGNMIKLKNRRVYLFGPNKDGDYHLVFKRLEGREVKGLDILMTGEVFNAVFSLMVDEVNERTIKQRGEKR